MCVCVYVQDTEARRAQERPMLPMARLRKLAANALNLHFIETMAAEES